VRELPFSTPDERQASAVRGGRLLQLIVARKSTSSRDTEEKRTMAICVQAPVLVVVQLSGGNDFHEHEYSVYQWVYYDSRQR